MGKSGHQDESRNCGTGWIEKKKAKHRNRKGHSEPQEELRDPPVMQKISPREAERKCPGVLTSFS